MEVAVKQTVDDYRTAWRIFNEFEQFVFEAETQRFSDFLMEWQSRMFNSKEHGMNYQDDILAFKLLKSSNVGEEVQNIVFQALQDRKMSDVEDLLLQTMACLSKVMENEMMSVLEEDNIQDNGLVEDYSGNLGGVEADVDIDETEIKVRPEELAELVMKGETKVGLTEEQGGNEEHEKENVALPEAISGKLKCCSCSSRFNDIYILELHQHNVHNLPLTCPECQDTFDTKRKFNAHLRNEHNIRKKGLIKTDAMCKQCGKTFRTRKGLTDHRRYHKEKYKCSKCLVKFEKKATLVNHMRKGPCFDSSVLPKEFVCDVCGKVFDKGFMYNKHMNTAHGNRYPCHLCIQRFAARKDLIVHLEEAHAGEYTLLTCEQCGKVFTQDEQLNQHIRTIHQKSVACDQCPKLFAKNCELLRHLKTHERKKEKQEKVQQNKAFQCEHCGKEIRGSRYYHMKTHFTFKCIPCGKDRFETQEELDEHQRNHKYYKCEKCDEQFTKMYLLKRHMELPIHSETTNYECELCGKTFYTKEKLNAHKVAHKSREHPCTMEGCGKSFRQPGMLKRHMLRHIGERKWMCPEPGCDKSFVTKSGMQYHQLRHTGIKNYKCTQCDKAFMFKDKLQRHIRTHTGEKQFKCDICENHYSQRKDLKAHLIKVHKILDAPVKTTLDELKHEDGPSVLVKVLNVQ